ncbi:MAG TPA: protein phosphatase 2C domain-containing protein [Anaerolineaceae bacterium]|nr:protein phosphatase 2C domain-containing protein [Anaerolineaceae bacterium]HPK26897.1 protein phosphatase 2C domain-containing protein [Anaerolineaceae bacterium]
MNPSTQLQSQAASSTGKVRTHNEDALFSLSTQVCLQAQHRALGLYMVADGMGGHVDGERASSLAIQAASRVLLQKFFDPLTLEPPFPSGKSVEALLNQAMQAAQMAVLEGVPGGGSTLTLALVLERQVYYAHVGDTRLYLYTHSGGLQALTRDHSVARRLVDLGQLNAAEAQVNPLRNSLFRALGQGEGFSADFGEVTIEAPAKLLLCSDGLWGTLPEDTLVKSLQAEPLPVDAAWKLVQTANAAGGADNISVIIVDIH